MSTEANCQAVWDTLAIPDSAPAQSCKDLYQPILQIQKVEFREVENYMLRRISTAKGKESFDEVKILCHSSTGWSRCLLKAPFPHCAGQFALLSAKSDARTWDLGFVLLFGPFDPPQHLHSQNHLRDQCVCGWVGLGQGVWVTLDKENKPEVI